MNPYQILPIILLSFLGLVGQAQIKELDAAKLEPKVDALIKQYTDLDIFSGVVLIAQQGQAHYHKAFGLADRSQNIPNQLNTKFDIGSFNKTFTKMVILQLVQEGKLRMKDKLGSYLNGFPKEAADRIQIVHLLEHRSGYGDYFYPGYFEADASEKTIAALVERIKKMPLAFKPGKGQEYSNAGYILLGAIIEEITGKSYYENVRERIVKPLELNDTYLENKSAVPDRAIGYYKDMKGNLLNNQGYIELPNPDGGFQSTTLDMLRFYREYFYGNRILKVESKKLDALYPFFQKHMDSGAAIPMAGGYEGANTAIYEVLRDQISIIVFANMDEPVAEQVGLGILNLIRGKETASPSLPAIQNVYQHLQEHGIESVKENYESLIQNFHPDDPPALILYEIGHELLRNKETDLALKVFQLNRDLYPENPHVWNSLGEAWIQKGEAQKANECMERASTLRGHSKGN